MSVRSGPYLCLTICLTLMGGCGAEAPGAERDVDAVDEDDDAEDGDDVGDDDADSADGDEDDDSDGDDAVELVDAAVGMAPRDAASARVDAGRDASATGDAASRDSATAKPDAASATDSGPSASDAGAPPGSGEKGACCADGECLCHGPAPTALTSGRGPYKTAELRIAAGTVVYPTDAEPPFAAVAVCGGFLNTGPEMASWGPFYASHGIVTVITTTGAADIPDIRAGKLLAAIAELKAENMKSGSPLSGKLSGRYGTSGYSMGGGGTTIASSDESTLKTSVGLAPWGGSGTGVKVPTLLLCGTSDTTAPCSMAQGVYRGIAESTPKMLVSITGVSHFNWFGPTDAGRGTSGAYALAFQKVYLEGDERWKPLLKEMPTNGMQTTNID